MKILAKARRQLLALGAIAVLSIAIVAPAGATGTSLSVGTCNATGSSSFASGQGYADTTGYSGCTGYQRYLRTFWVVDGVPSETYYEDWDTSNRGWFIPSNADEMYSDHNLCTNDYTSCNGFEGTYDIK